MISNSVLRLIVAGVGAVVLVGGCASASINNAGYEAPGAGSENLSAGAGSLKVVSALPSPAASGGGGQVIRVGDKLRVDVFGVDELDREVPVDGSGRVTLPLVGGVQVAGMSLEATQSQITSLYGARYLQNPEISVSVEQTVTLDGEFRKAGFYPVSGNSSLLRVIAAAGNFTDIGDPNNVFVYRTVGGQDYVAQYNVADIRAGRRAMTATPGRDTARRSNLSKSRSIRSSCSGWSFATVG
jgi:polysaccharide export outer membrane protein